MFAKMVLESRVEWRVKETQVLSSQEPAFNAGTPCFLVGARVWAVSSSMPLSPQVSLPHVKRDFLGLLYSCSAFLSSKGCALCFTDTLSEWKEALSPLLTLQPSIGLT